MRKLYYNKEESIRLSMYFAFSQTELHIHKATAIEKSVVGKICRHLSFTGVGVARHSIYTITKSVLK